ncbi:MAG: molybdate ABC transporter substrate-binding protein [Chroococcidiopsidaceae cyanobacterium CP_BM_RX_35]|nr:molybdate ABC transporter substrate-binding protein [Chroococcidiopsidaceae cyanobacterium CP_BM_RX_35]
MHKKRILAFIGSILLTFLFAVSCSQTPPNAHSSSALTVSAAASLKDAMGDIKQLYTQTNLTYNFGGSGSLQQQIEQGAPVDVFISAAPKQMNALQKKGLVLTETRKNLLRNEVVLIAPKTSTAVSDFKDLTNDKVKRIALGEPNSVPVGKYSQEVLTSLGLFAQLKPKIVFAKDVRQVLSYVETGNADAGIVYITDAKISNKVKIVATAPAKSHSSIVYPVAVLKDSKNIDAAKQFVQFLFSERAKAVFEKYGFSSLS